MKIVIQFNSQSKSKNIPEAIKIAKNLKAEFDGKYYRVLFDSISDKNLSILSRLIGYLSGSILFIDNEDFRCPYNLEERIDYVINCPRKLDCNGQCLHCNEFDLKIAREYCYKFKKTKKKEIKKNGKKMKIVIQFNSQSRGRNVSEAIKIAKNLKAEFDGKYYRVLFDSIFDKNLSLLSRLVISY